MKCKYYDKTKVDCCTVKKCCVDRVGNIPAPGWRDVREELINFIDANNYTKEGQGFSGHIIEIDYNMLISKIKTLLPAPPEGKGE
jgi:hypothetical protein